MCTHQMAALLCMKWHHGCHFESVAANRKSDSVKCCTFIWRIFLPNFIRIPFETMELRLFSSCHDKKNKNNNKKMSSDMWSVHDPKIISQYFFGGRYREKYGVSVFDIWCNLHGILLCVNSISIISKHWNWKLVCQCIGESVYGRCLQVGRVCHVKQGILLFDSVLVYNSMCSVIGSWYVHCNISSEVKPFYLHEFHFILSNLHKHFGWHSSRMSVESCAAMVIMTMVWIVNRLMSCCHAGSRRPKTNRQATRRRLLSTKAVSVKHSFSFFQALLSDL